jgi:hypothetical protein
VRLEPASLPRANLINTGKVNPKRFNKKKNIHTPKQSINVHILICNKKNTNGKEEYASKIKNSGVRAESRQWAVSGLRIFKPRI